MTENSPSGDGDFDSIGIEVIDARDLVVIMLVDTSGTLTFRYRVDEEDVLTALAAAAKEVSTRQAARNGDA